MTTPQQLAKHLRDVHFGGNWTCANLREQLQQVDWQQSTRKVHGLNTIATLSYHVHYFVEAILKVMRGGPLDSKDIYSFDHPPIHSPQDWQALQDKIWADAEALAELVEQMPEEQLAQPFTDPKYGNWHRNLLGVIEHTHYHLGQIALIKKLTQSSEPP